MQDIGIGDEMKDYLQIRQDIENDPMLGRTTDTAIAKKHAVSVDYVSKVRRGLGFPSYASGEPRRITTREIGQLMRAWRC